MASYYDVEYEEYFVGQINPLSMNVDRAEVKCEIECSNIGVFGLWEIGFHG